MVKKSGHVPQPNPRPDGGRDRGWGPLFAVWRENEFQNCILVLYGMNISNIIHFMLFLRKKRKCAYSINNMLLLYKLIYIILAIFFECDSMEFLFYKFFKLKLRNDQSDFCQSFFQSKNFVIKIFSDSNFFYFSYRHVFKNP